MVINKEELALIKDTFKYIKPYKKRLVINIIITMVLVGVGLLQPFLLGGIIEKISLREWTSDIYTYIFLFVVVDIITITLSSINQIINSKISNDVGIDLKNEIYENMIHIQMKHFDQTSVGEFISRLEGDTSKFIDVITNRFINILVTLCRTIFVGILVFKINFYMASVVLATFPITYYIYKKFGKKIRTESEEMKKIGDKYYGYINQSISGIKYIKINRLYETNFKAYRDLNEEVKSKNIKIMFLNIVCNIFVYISSNIDTVFVLILGIYYVKSGELTVQLFMAFISYAAQFSGGLESLTNLNVVLQEIIVSIKRVFGIINHSLFERETEGKINLEYMNDEIAFDNVTFSYNDDNKVFENLTFNIKSDDLTVIMGKSGEGKSTILNLLASIYSIDNGEIRIGNHNIKNLSSEFFKKNISYLPQEPFLFNMSIRDNFRIIVKDATDEEIIESCKKAYIYEHIESLEKGLDTIIEDKVSNLSYGQYKRLNLAICLLKNSPIILLDEITSGLDIENKNMIINTIKNISKNKKVIVVSHDLDIIKHAKNVMKLENGKIIEYIEEKLVI